MRASALGEASRLLAELAQRGLRTICFAKSRKAAELVHRFTRRPARPGDRGAALALPRRLHAAAAARDRAAARRGRPARRHRHGRARARHRHRPARLRDLGRLPGHGRVAAPAVGPRRTPRPRARRARRERGRARPVLHARARRRCSAAGSRRRSSTTRTRACSTATCARRRSRRRSTTPTARRSATRRSSARRELPELEHTPRGFVWAGRDYPAGARPAPLDEPRLVHGRRRRDRLAARPRRARDARTRPCTRAPSTSTWASATSCASSTSTAARALVAPFAGDWYTQAKKETMTAIEEPLRVERRLGTGARRSARRR